MLGIIIPKEKILIWISLLCLVIISIIYFIPNYKCIRDTFSSKYEIENNDEGRRAFIESFNIKLKSVPCMKDTVTIPHTFDSVFSGYEKIQNEMGLSLENFKGMKLNKYTYEVESPDSILYANLFIYDKYVVACDIVNPDINFGFIKSFIDFME